MEKKEKEKKKKKKKCSKEMTKETQIHWEDFVLFFTGTGSKKKKGEKRDKKEERFIPLKPVIPVTH